MQLFIEKDYSALSTYINGNNHRSCCHRHSGKRKTNATYARRPRYDVLIKRNKKRLADFFRGSFLVSGKSLTLQLSSILLL
jgi:hypothetical protein